MLKSLVLASLFATYSLGQKPTWYQDSVPSTTEAGQTGTNRCVDTSNASTCQNVIVNSLEDFCLWGPPSGPTSVGETEEIEVAYCTQATHGARVMPAGTITGAHYLETPNYVQITGTGNFGLININAVGGGGELDPHGATGNGNPIGGLVFSNIAGFGNANVQEWTNFMSDQQFCIRICKPAPDAYLYCQHIYDVMGCDWSNPGTYSTNAFSSCSGDSSGYPGIDGGSTFHQGDPITPPAHKAGASSNCRNIATIVPGTGSSPTTVSSQFSTLITSTSSSTSTSTTTSSASITSTISSTSSTSTSDGTAPLTSLSTLSISSSSTSTQSSSTFFVTASPTSTASIISSAAVATTGVISTSAGENKSVVLKRAMKVFGAISAITWFA